MSRLLILLLATLMLNPVYGAQILNKNLGWPGTTLEGHECHGKDVGYGPFDYNDPQSSSPDGSSRDSNQDRLSLVERYHFDSNTENLITGASNTDPKSDIDYTLRAFPNHPRALLAISRYFLRLPADNPKTKYALARGIGDVPPPECYFQRAKLFAPEDPMVSMVFGIYLHKRGLLDAAIAEYRLAEQEMPKYAELAYNMGLAYFDLKDYENAKKYAARAYALGYPLPGLKRKLAGVDIDLSTK